MMNESYTPLDPLLFDRAEQLDVDDPIAGFREEFYFPQTETGQDELYFVGNSLGLQPKGTREFVMRELDAWQSLGVRGHFEGEYPWMPYHEFLAEGMAEIVGAHSDEVVVMNTLTVNLHLMMASFYRPEGKRNRIMLESHAFPSDHYAVESQIKWHGLNPSDCMLLVDPDEDRETISTDRICELIRKHHDELALVLLPGVQYYTGQVFDMRVITKTAHEYGIMVGFDLAHAAGNVPLSLSQWGVDFACWCTYKYLNSGPGAVGGCYVNSKHGRNSACPRLAGWWGHDKASRFRMENRFVPIQTAEGWQLSNPPILSLAAIRASLDVFQRVGGMSNLREKSLKLTGFFYECLDGMLPEQVHSLTPRDPASRGCQLSLSIQLRERNGKSVYEQLKNAGIRTDWREPNVIRAAPVPLYNSYQDVYRFVDQLASLLEAV